MRGGPKYWIEVQPKKGIFFFFFHVIWEGNLFLGEGGRAKVSPTKNRQGQGSKGGKQGKFILPLPLWLKNEPWTCLFLLDGTFGPAYSRTSWALRDQQLTFDAFKQVNKKGYSFLLYNIPHPPPWPAFFLFLNKRHLPFNFLFLFSPLSLSRGVESSTISFINFSILGSNNRFFDKLYDGSL